MWSSVFTLTKVTFSHSLAGKRNARETFARMDVIELEMIKVQNEILSKSRTGNSSFFLNRNMIVDYFELLHGRLCEEGKGLQAT